MFMELIVSFKYMYLIIIIITSKDCEKIVVNRLDSSLNFRQEKENVKEWYIVFVLFKCVMKIETLPYSSLVFILCWRT